MAVDSRWVNAESIYGVTAVDGEARMHFGPDDFVTRLQFRPT